MQVLILYESIEGHTRKIAETIAGQIEKAGNEVFLTRASDPTFCDPAQYDAAVLCAPVHIGTYPTAFTSFVQNWNASLKEVPTAFVSVSLAAAGDDRDGTHEAAGYVDDFVEKTGWTADEVHHAAGALKYLEYNYFKRWMMRRIVEQEGGPVDTNKDYELTNWAGLADFVADFLETCAVTGS